MLKTPVIMKISDIETAIEDYKYGQYSDPEFLKALQIKTRELEKAIEITTNK